MAAVHMRTRRLPRCSCCELPEPLCLGEIAAIAARTPIVVLLHPSERRKSSNTGRILERVLTSATIHVHGTEAKVPLAARRLVLFPTADARELVAGDAGALLVALDGTWAQARRMLRRDRWAAGAELVRLPPGAPSRYFLRRNSRDDGLCTLEAVARALAIVEDPSIAARLGEVLDAFVSRATALRQGRLPVGSGGTCPVGELRPAPPSTTSRS
jgi:tRNA-uridine aminocarboxypropyltransferase